MESINTLKGYGKVSDQENQIPPSSPLPKPSSRKTLVAIASLLLILAVVVALTAGAFTRPPSHNPPAPVSSSSNSLKIVCAVTPYPQTCLDALSSSSLKESDPESILELSLRLASERVSALSVSFRSIDDMPEEPAVKDCAKLYADAGSQLNETLSEIVAEKKGGGNWMTEKVVGDVKTWISAAMTDGETCSDGLEEMGTVVGNEIKREMVRVNQMMSVCLAIVSQMKKLLLVLH